MIELGYRDTPFEAIASSQTWLPDRFLKNPDTLSSTQIPLLCMTLASSSYS